MTDRKDFFVSYTGVDEARAEWIVRELEDAGHTTISQVLDFGPGDNFVHRMHDALQRADRMVAVLTPAYTRSAFAGAEWQKVFADDPNGELRLLVPVRAADFTPPGLLRTRVYIDLVGLDEAASRTALLDGIAPNRRQKPRGPFPGVVT